MNRTTKPKGIGIAAAGLLAALLIAAAILPAMGVAETTDEDIGIKSCQKIDITAQKVKLYVDPDGPGDNTGELYAEYTTDCGDFDVKTGVISVPQNHEFNGIKLKEPALLLLYDPIYKKILKQETVNYTTFSPDYMGTSTKNAEREDIENKTSKFSNWLELE